MVASSIALVFPVIAVLGADASDELAETFANSQAMNLVLIRPDQYLTGTRLDRSNWRWYERDEIPRWVTLTEPFYMAAHEVTNAQYRQFVRETGRPEPKGLLLRGLTLVQDFEPWRDPGFQADDQPVVCVTYADAEAFCHWLSGKEGRPYRLPTSDEWEYACRAGWGTDFNWGSDRITPEMARYDPLLVEDDLPAGQPAMVPLVSTVKLLGGNVEFSAERQQATGTIAHRSFEVAAGKREARVQGNPVTLDAPAAVLEGELMVPVRFLAFDLGLLFTGGPVRVGSFKPNAWGLYDMHGNVNEITSTGADFRFVRGGGWNDSARRCRSASVRDRWKSDCAMAGIGFRVVAGAPAKRHLDVAVGEPLLVKATTEKELSEFGRKILLLGDGALVVHDRMSRDGGKTWNACPLQPNPIAIQTANGTILSVPFMIPRDPDRPAGWGKARCLQSIDGWTTATPLDATFSVPEAIGGFDDGGNYRDSIGYCDHDVVELPGGDLLMTMYGFWQSARVLSDYQRYPIETQQWKYVAWIVKSSDRGQTWTYLSQGILHSEMTRAGGCELGLVRLANGHLLLAGRTGEHGYPNERMLFVWSQDQGATWGQPRNLQVDERPILGIFPQFALLSDGILAMTWGRTGSAASAVAFNVDGTGRTWTDFTPIPDDLGGYNDIVQISPGTLLVSSSKKTSSGYDLHLIPVRVSRPKRS